MAERIPVPARRPEESERPHLGTFEGPAYEEKKIEYDPLTRFFAGKFGFTYETVRGARLEADPGNPNEERFVVVTDEHSNYHDALKQERDISRWQKESMDRLFASRGTGWSSARLIVRAPEELSRRLKDPADPLFKARHDFGVLLEEVKTGRCPDGYAEAVARGEIARAERNTPIRRKGSSQGARQGEVPDIDLAERHARRIEARVVQAAFRRWPIFPGDRARLAYEEAAFREGTVFPGGAVERKRNFIKEIQARCAVGSGVAEATYVMELKSVEDRRKKIKEEHSGTSLHEKEIGILEGLGFSSAEYLDPSYLRVLRRIKVKDFLNHFPVKDNVPDERTMGQMRTLSAGADSATIKIVPQHVRLAQFVRVFAESDSAIGNMTLGEFLRRTRKTRRFDSDA